jgi:hypothetical protein
MGFLANTQCFEIRLAGTIERGNAVAEGAESLTLLAFALVVSA